MDEEKVITHIITLDESVHTIKDTVATKNDIREVKQMIEGLTTLTKKIHEDHVFAPKWLKRLHTQIERQDEDIRAIKLKLGMV